MKAGFISKRDSLLAKYSSDFGDEKINERLQYWKNKLETSISNGWSIDAKKYFIGKRLLKELQVSIFGTKNISLWEHILASEEDECLETIKPLRDLIGKI